MSTPTTTPPVVLSCEDSPLSTTGNVLGILTFAAAIYVSVLVYVNSMRSASKRYSDMLERLELRYREAEHLRYKLEARQHTSASDDRPNPINHVRIQIALNCTVKPLGEAMRALQKFRGRDLRRRGTMDFQGRVRFVMQEDAVQDLLGKVEKAVGDLRDVADDILEQSSIKPASHEVNFRTEVLQELVELRNEMRNLRDGDARLLHEIRDLMQGMVQTRPRRTSF